MHRGASVPCARRLRRATGELERRAVRLGARAGSGPPKTRIHGELFFPRPPIRPTRASPDAVLARVQPRVLT